MGAFGWRTQPGQSSTSGAVIASHQLDGSQHVQCLRAVCFPAPQPSRRTEGDTDTQSAPPSSDAQQYDVGPTGKTHLAIAIARACIRDGARGRFFNVVDLVNRLDRASRIEITQAVEMLP